MTGYTPRWQPGACGFKLGAGMVQGKTVRCGYLVVPEDRSRPRGRQIRLAVAIFRTPSQNRLPDPLIFLQGGPGGRIVKDLGSIVNSQDALPLMGRHDLILIDQRGTGLSHPALNCWEVTNLQIRTLKQNLSPQRQVALENRAVQQCRRRLVRQVTLSAYATMADAADIADLRRALGYRAIDLYGVSYGTRIALTIMRSFPTGIRSVILDSVVTPRFNLLADQFQSEARLFNVLFRGCAQARSCNRTYPRLQSTFYSLIRRLNRKPVTITADDASSGKRYQVLVNGYGLSDLVWTTPYDSSLISQLPKMLSQVEHGTYSLLARIYGDIGFSFEDIDLGTYFSMDCGDDGDFTNSRQVAASVQALPALLRPYALTNGFGFLQECKIWNVPPAPATQRQPVTSSIPTLVLAGQYDLITPPANSQTVTKTLPHSYFFEFPGIGHAVRLSDPCPNTMTLAFLDDPTQKPDASCIATMGSPFGH